MALPAGFIYQFGGREILKTISHLLCIKFQLQYCNDIVTGTSILHIKGRVSLPASETENKSKASGGGR